MSILKTIGGDRLGAGNKMQTALHNYNRSTHNLSSSWRSTMAPGVLVPFMSEVALNGDTFDIDLNALARTIPTQGPLLGSFKLQMDVFQCPMRLYQGILHNNPINVGLEMNKIKLPIIKTGTATIFEQEDGGGRFSNSCLMKYLGVSGIGKIAGVDTGDVVYRNFNAVPILAYYDIFKNYYANKQESKAYVLTGGYDPTNYAIITTLLGGGALRELPQNPNYYAGDNSFSFLVIGKHCKLKSLNLKFTEWNNDEKAWQANNEYVANIYDLVYDFEHTPFANNEIIKDVVLSDYQENVGKENMYDTFTITYKDGNGLIDKMGAFTLEPNDNLVDEEVIKLLPFDLNKIDEARQVILSKNKITDIVEITDESESGAINFLPYAANANRNAYETTWNKFKMNGLCVKTYQADLFNAWINTEWIDGTNGIAAITTIDTTDGLNLDTLNLAQKVYNMLNRIAVSGGSYQDWQEAVYGVDAIKHCESPIYLGGMASEIAFEEVVATAQTSEDNALGALAGKGKLMGKRGGHILVKVNEPSYIMGIVSITPRIDYTQGNKWDMTDIFSIDDLHKPALDGIGFQDLLQEQAHYGGTSIEWDDEDMEYSMTRKKIGKVPAWINYMTAFDQSFGDFADENSKQFMILARQYEFGHTNQDHRSRILDLTTYIDPAKFNYAFAYTERAAQNFWIQIYKDIKARRIMSAKVIPNL